MSTTAISNPDIQLTVEQLIGAIRKLEPDARFKIAQTLLDDEMDERFVQLIKRLENKAPVTDITDEAIDAEVRAVRRRQL